jgi:hypothetical protein
MGVSHLLVDILSECCSGRPGRALPLPGPVSRSGPPPRTPLGRFAAPTLRCKDGVVKPAPLPPMTRALPTADAWRQCPRTAWRDYLLSQHADPKSKGRVPTVFVTRLQDFSGSMEWFVHGSSLLWPEGDFLWDDVQGDPCSHSAVLSRCPLDVGRIQRSMHIVLREACGPSAARPPSSLSIVRARPSSQMGRTSRRVPMGAVHRTWSLGGDSIVSMLRAPDTRVLTLVKNLFCFLSLFRTFGDLWASPLGSPAGHGRPACKGAG